MFWFSLKCCASSSEGVHASTWLQGLPSGANFQASERCGSDAGRELRGWPGCLPQVRCTGAEGRRKGLAAWVTSLERATPTQPPSPRSGGMGLRGEQPLSAPNMCWKRVNYAQKSSCPSSHLHLREGAWKTAAPCKCLWSGGKENNPGTRFINYRCLASVRCDFFRAVFTPNY